MAPKNRRGNNKNNTAVSVDTGGNEEQTRQSQTPPAQQPQQQQQQAATKAQTPSKGGRKNNKKNYNNDGGSPKKQSAHQAHRKPPMMTMRHAYDSMRLASGGIIERSAAALHLDEAAATQAVTPADDNLSQHTHTPNARAARSASSVGHSAPVPSITHVLAAAARLDELVAAIPQRVPSDKSAQELQADIKAEQLITFSKLISWYCLETASESGLSVHFTPTASGRATPAAAARGRGRGRAAPTVITNINASAASSVTSHTHNAGGAVNDWLGSRMSSPSPTATLTDDQLIGHLQRPAVELVAKLAGISSILSTTEAPAQHKEEGNKKRGNNNNNKRQADAEQASVVEQLRSSALMLLCAIITRFPDADFRSATFLPMLFPEMDIRCGVAEAHTDNQSHPILSPLVLDRSATVRDSAALLLIALLHKLQITLQYAEEPKRSRQSFMSLATQGGAALLAIHDAVHWAMGGNDPNGNSNFAKPPQYVTQGNKTALLTVYGTLAVITPYKRCPGSLDVILRTIQLPVVRNLLKAENGPEYTAVTNFLASVFTNEALRGPVSQLLSAKDTGAGGILSLLLTHARERVEVWRCLVQVARLYPSLIHQHFRALLTASEDVVQTLLRQEARVQQSHADPNAAKQPAPRSEAMSASPEAFAECLRAWIHFMGYVWKAFDNNPEDPALLDENQADRATIQQKHEVYKHIISASMKLKRSEEVSIMTLRAVAQLGESFLSSEYIPSSERERIVAFANACIADWSDRVRSEALVTLGMWAWQYPSLDTHGPHFVDCAADVLCNDPNPVVRTKAAFALSNLTSRLGEESSLIRKSVEHMDRLNNSAMQAVNDSSSVVQGHGIRMLNHLLYVLTFEELIDELIPDGFMPDEECIAEGFLRVLLQCVSVTSREAKHRWNAACALGMGYASGAVFEAEPRYAMESVQSLMHAVVHDRIFKVRSQAAIALSRIPSEILASTVDEEELGPQVLRALCTALGSARATENFAQYKEQGSLRESLKKSLGVILTTSSPSGGLDKVIAEYRQVLTSEGLL